MSLISVNQWMSAEVKYLYQPIKVALTGEILKVPAYFLVDSGKFISFSALT